jgi:mannosyltransferase
LRRAPSIGYQSMIPMASSAPVASAAASARRSDTIVVTAIAVAAFVSSLPGLGARSLWGDEAFSVGLARQPWHVFWSYVWGQECNMSLYWVGLRAWLALLNAANVPATEFLIRLPSAVAAASAVGVVYLIGRQLIGRKAALLGAALYWLNYLQLYQTLDARAYAFEMLLTNFGWYALLRWRRQPEQRRWELFYGLSMAVAVYFHYYAFVVLGAQLVAVALIAWFRSSARWRSVAAEAKGMARPVMLVVALALPTLVDAAVHGGHNDWVPPAHLLSFGALARDVAGYSPLYFIALSLAVLLAFGAVLASQSRPAAPTSLLSTASWTQAPREVMILLGCWIAVPPLAAFAVTQPFLNLHLFNPTYLVVIVPGACLLAAAGALTFRRSAARVGAALLITVCAATAVPNYFASAPRVDNLALVSWIDAHRQAGDGLVTTSNKASVTLDYYFGPASRTPYFTDAYPGRFSWENQAMNTAYLSDAGIAAYAETRPRVFFVAYTPLFLSQLDPTAQSGLHSLENRYRLIDQRVWRTTLGSEVWVRLYDTAGQPK